MDQSRWTILGPRPAVPPTPPQELTMLTIGDRFPTFRLKGVVSGEM
jgi:hypothetical protein